jgi:N-acetylglucosaminyldiphosphoundecaprenol N-acetyl-beta-D-mannosaminyltransferase
MEIPKESFFGLDVSIFSEKELNEYFEYILEVKKPHVLYGYSIGLLPYVKKYPEIIEYSNHFDLLVTDGKIFYFLAKKCNIPVYYNLSIPQMVLKFLRIANTKKLKILLLGAKKSVNDKATENIRKKYPLAKVIDGIDGYFDKNEEQKVVDKISLISPDILFVGMHSPYKEYFSYKYKNKLNTKIIIPCGGMIDVLAGKTKLTPNWVKNIGLAWLYRLMQQPFQRFEITRNFIIIFFKILWHKDIRKKTSNVSILDII